MQHLNYCRQLIKQFSTETQILEPLLKDFKSHCVDLAKTSQKFILPDGGRFYDDPELKALDETEKLHLPFPCIAIEFTRSKEYLATLPPKSAERYQPDRTLFFAKEFDDHIAITVLVWAMDIKKWIPYPQAGIPRSNYLDRTARVGGRIGIRVIPPSKLPELKDTTDESMLDDYDDEVGALLNLLNVLSCRNVHTEKSLPKKTSMAMNAGKKNAVPFDAYHYLVIDTPKKSESSGVGGSHASPREHLRRGHIRRLADGRRIWVNATVVSAGSGGVVAKDYVMRGAHGTNA
jgi:hypothetical protein